MGSTGLDGLVIPLTRATGRKGRLWLLWFLLKPSLGVSMALRTVRGVAASACREHLGQESCRSLRVTDVRG